MTWTPDRIQSLKARYATEGAAALAREWGLTRSAVAGKAHHLGLSVPGHGKWERPRSMTARRKPRRRPLPIPQEAAEPPPTLVNERRQCAWPISGHGQHTAFCCDPVEIRKGRSLPYCPTHASRAYVR